MKRRSSSIGRARWVLTLLPMRREMEIEFNLMDEVVLKLLPMRRERDIEFNWTGEMGFDVVANET